MIDRVYTKAEARYIPNGDGSTADMSHPTRTGDVVAFSYPPYQFDAATPGTLVALSAFFGQHGYVPDVQDLENGINMRATFLAGGDRIGRGTRDDVRTIDLAPTIAYLLGVPEPQHSQGVVRLDMLKDGWSRKLVPLVGLNDFHGQLDQTTFTMDGRAVTVGGAAQLATMFDEEMAQFAPGASLLAAGDNVGASPANSSLLQDMPAIDVENAWGLDATSYGNHEFDYGVERLKQHQERADFPFLGANIVDEATGENPDWVQGTHVVEYQGVRIGVIGIELESTPELVSAGATAGLAFLPAIETIQTESAKLRSQGIRVQVVVIHEGTAVGTNTVDAVPGVPWDGPDRRHRQWHPGHDRRRHHRRTHSPGVEPDGGRHPGRRRHQRRGELLGRPDGDQGSRRRVGGRCHPHRQEHRRRQACRRAGHRRRCQCPDRGVAQPGHRQPVDRHQTRT